MADSEPEVPDNAMDAETRSMIERLEEDLRRPPERRDFEAELLTALRMGDVACCRELLSLNQRWLRHFKGHELANLLAAAIVSGPAAGELVDLLLAAGVPARCVDDQLRSVPVARHLLEHGADPALTDQCGSLPEDWMHMPKPVRRMLQEWRMAQVRDGRKLRK
jgi:hypothetical protein